MTSTRPITEQSIDDLTPDTGAPLDHGADATLDRINLEQALRDFELANRRVIDLSQRVASLHRELLEARTELSLTKIQLDHASRSVDRLRGSRLFPMVRALARATRTFRR